MEIESVKCDCCDLKEDCTEAYIPKVKEIESVKCDCCGLKEDCTQAYISKVKAEFTEKWLCGLCAEAVRDEMTQGKCKPIIEEAIKSHMSFCRNFKSNPAVQVADGMCQLLRKRSGRFQIRKS